MCNRPSLAPETLVVHGAVDRRGIFDVAAASVIKNALCLGFGVGRSFRWVKGQLALPKKGTGGLCGERAGAKLGGTNI
jgi:hypothetical protein